MDVFLKRKDHPGGTSMDNKRAKRENCPHSERCFRRNPHHFKEYEHPHLMNLIKMGDAMVIPENFPQPKNVYMEQIDILKPMIAACSKSDNPSKTENKITSKGAALDVHIVSDKKNSTNKTKNAYSSGSSSSNNNNRKNEKNTCFIPNMSSVSSDAVLSKGTMLEKLKRNEPYNVFYTTVPKSPDTFKQSNAITLTDILCPSLGVLKSSLQINFMIDVSWLLEQYQARNLQSKPLTIVYGYEFPHMDVFMKKFCPNVTPKLVKMKDPFGVHHSKVGIYAYEDGSIRIVVSTANLYYEDWNHYNQGLWLSPKCPKLPESSAKTDGESPTGFKKDLLKYLKDYNFPCLKEWIEYVEKVDFSAVKVFLVTSVPGRHFPRADGSHLHRVADLLTKYCSLPSKTTPESEGPLSWGVFAQASSIGSLGKTPAEWLRRCMLRSLASHIQGPIPSNSQATLNVVYPSVDNVMKGYFGPESGGCLPYSKQVNEKQRWLQDYLHQWKADGLTRTRAMPHIKSYCRISPCLTKLAYYLLTSANISKSAWGSNFHKDSSVYIRSYEVGVMFLPKFFDQEYFVIKDYSNENKNLFPFMYDLPLESYKSDDYPWCN